MLGAAIFSTGLAVDAWRIAEQLQVDDFVEAAVQLYVDVAAWWNALGLGFRRKNA